MKQVGKSLLCRVLCFWLVRKDGKEGAEILRGREEKDKEQPRELLPAVPSATVKTSQWQTTYHITRRNKDSLLAENSTFANSSKKALAGRSCWLLPSTCDKHV